MSCGISHDRCFCAFYVTGGIMRIVKNICMAFLVNDGVKDEVIKCDYHV